MIKICIYFEKKNLNKLLNSLQKLKLHRPVYFNCDEKLKAKDKKNKTNDAEKFILFRTFHPGGFLLHAKECIYNISIRDKGYSTLNIFPSGSLSTNWIETFFETIAVANPMFGYAAAGSEYKHRNRIFVTQGKNHIESWVGRDLNKYIPGLYYYTLLSKRVLDTLGVSYSELVSLALSEKTMPLDATLSLVNYFENADSWSDNKIQLDQLCEQIPGVFSKIEVEKQAKETSDYMAFCDVIDKWD